MHLLNRVAFAAALICASCASMSSGESEGPSLSVRATVNGNGFAASNLKATVVVVKGGIFGGVYHVTDFRALKLYGPPLEAFDRVILRIDRETVIDEPYDPSQGYDFPAWTEDLVRRVVDEDTLTIWGLGFADSD